MNKLAKIGIISGIGIAIFLFLNRKSASAAEVVKDEFKPATNLQKQIEQNLASISPSFSEKINKIILSSNQQVKAAQDKADQQVKAAQDKADQQVKAIQDKGTKTISNIQSYADKELADLKSKMQLASSLNLQDLITNYQQRDEVIRTETLKKIQVARDEATQQVQAAQTQATQQVQAAQTQATQQVQAVREELLQKISIAQPPATPPPPPTPPSHGSQRFRASRFLESPGTFQVPDGVTSVDVTTGLDLPGAVPLTKNSYTVTPRQNFVLPEATILVEW